MIDAIDVQIHIMKHSVAVEEIQVYWNIVTFLFCFQGGEGGGEREERGLRRHLWMHGAVCGGDVEANQPPALHRGCLDAGIRFCGHRPRWQTQR